MSEGCYFCGGGEDVLERHHIVPRRFGGSDAEENLVDLCPTCHERLERIYDDRFYMEIGAGAREAPDEFVQILEDVLINIDFSDVGFETRPEILGRTIGRLNANNQVCPMCHRLAHPEDRGDPETCSRCEADLEVTNGD